MKVSTAFYWGDTMTCRHCGGHVPDAGQRSSCPLCSGSSIHDITLHIEENTLNSLRSALHVRGISGVHVGILEAFTHKIFDSIDKGVTDADFKLKKSHG